MNVTQLTMPNERRTAPRSLPRHPRQCGRGAPRRGVVLLAVLVVVTILALGAYTFSQSMTVEAQSSHMYGRAVQAQMLADSGLELVMTLLANPQLLEEMGGNLYHNPAAFENVLVRDDPGAPWRGRFSVLVAVEGQPEEDAVRFGLLDESARLNLNALMQLDAQGDLAAQALLGLPGMDVELADAIIDWLDSNATPRPFGAEDEYYGAFATKNGPLESLDELLYVRGVVPGLLLGEDYNRNGLLDPNENDGALYFPDDNGDGVLDRGWLPYVTLYSREANRSADGRPRINLNDQDQNALGEQLAEEFGQEVADFVRLYRQFGPYQEPDELEEPQQEPEDASANEASGSAGGVAAQSGGAGQGGGNVQIGSILDLIDARVQDRSQNQNQGGGQGGQPAGGPGGAGPAGPTGAPGQAGGSPEQQNEPPIIESPFRSQDARNYLPQLYDRLTTRSDEVIVGRVNVNAAPRAVLVGLPGMDEGIVEQIMAMQSTANTSLEEIYQTPAWLFTENVVTLEHMKRLEPWVTARGGVFRVQVVGYFDEGGPTARIEAVIDTTESGPPRLLYWRELSELGEGFKRAALRGSASE